MSSYLRNGLPVIPDEFFAGDESVFDAGTCTGPATTPLCPARQSDIIVLPARRRTDRAQEDWFLALFIFLILVLFTAGGVLIGYQWEHGSRDGRAADAIEARLRQESIHE